MKRPKVTDFTETIYRADSYKYTQAQEKYIDYLEEQNKQLTLGGVVSSAFLVQHKETLISFGLFSTRKKAENYINKNTDLFKIQEVKIG